MKNISNLKSPAPKERGSPSPTFGTKVGLGGKSQIYILNLKTNVSSKLKAQSAPKESLRLSTGQAKLKGKA